MTLIKFNPEVQKNGNSFSPFANMINEVFDHGYAGNYKFSRPMTNVLENEDEFCIEMAVPGYNKDHINIKVEDDVLTITGDLKRDESVKKNYKRVEFNYEGFERSFTLSDHVDTENIKADYKDGILSIILPKREDRKPRSRNILIS